MQSLVFSGRPESTASFLLFLLARPVIDPASVHGLSLSRIFLDEDGEVIDKFLRNLVNLDSLTFDVSEHEFTPDPA